MLLVEKGTLCKSSGKRNDMEGQGIDKECVAQNWFRYFKEGDNSLEDKMWPGKPSIKEDEN